MVQPYESWVGKIKRMHARCRVDGLGKVCFLGNQPRTWGTEHIHVYMCYNI